LLCQRRSPARIYERHQYKTAAEPQPTARTETRDHKKNKTRQECALRGKHAIAAAAATATATARVRNEQAKLQKHSDSEATKMAGINKEPLRYVFHFVLFYLSYKIFLLLGLTSFLGVATYTAVVWQGPCVATLLFDFAFTWGDLRGRLRSTSCLLNTCVCCCS
jgi:hypothetical protein